MIYVTGYFVMGIITACLNAVSGIYQQAQNDEDLARYFEFWQTAILMTLAMVIIWPVFLPLLIAELVREK